MHDFTHHFANNHFTNEFPSVIYEVVRWYDAIINDDNLPELITVREFDYDERGGRSHVLEILKNEIHLNKLATEHVFMVCFNPAWKMSIFLISTGTTMHADVSMNKMATYLLLSGAKSFSIYHNHTTQILEPSENDIRLSEAVESIADLLELDFLGSYILTKEGCINTDDFNDDEEGSIDTDDFEDDEEDS